MIPRTMTTPAADSGKAALRALHQGHASRGVVGPLRRQGWCRGGGRCFHLGPPLPVKSRLAEAGPNCFSAASPVQYLPKTCALDSKLRQYSGNHPSRELRQAGKAQRLTAVEMEMCICIEFKMHAVLIG